MEQNGFNQDTCFGSGSIAGAVIGTFLTTLLLLGVAGLLYRQWRRHKGKHLVLVTDPEIVEDAYAFDNPCFKDATSPAVITRTIERPVSAASAASVETPVKDATRWSTSWSSIGLGSNLKNDKRRTLDDSCLGPKATRVSLVSLRSRDFTGLGFNVCGNMREGIFVKDLLHRGPASESGRIHPGDRIASVKISFRNMVYEDALTILSYASPYDVVLEVETGVPGSKPTTLLKKSVGPSPTRICHPLYRSQSIPELSQSYKSASKRLFTVELSDTLMNSTMKSSKSASAATGNQSLDRRPLHEDAKSNHQKFGIKVLPALDGMVHRIENDNEHNTNLERRNSKKIDTEETLTNSRNVMIVADVIPAEGKKALENFQQESNAKAKIIGPITSKAFEPNGIDVPDKGNEGRIPSEIPEEVHNAAVAARRNRRNSAELLSSTPIKSNTESTDPDDSSTDPKSPSQKNKRKAPAPPKEKTVEVTIDNMKKTSPNSQSFQGQNYNNDLNTSGEDKFDSITDYTESLSDYLNKVRETTDGAEARRQRLEKNQTCRRNSESDTDSELQNSFTTIELNPGDITIHHTPVPGVEDEDDDDDDIYRKAASLGDLSKYESKASSTLERAQSLDMTDSGSKKRKAPLPPEDINESTEDLTKLDDMDTFQRRKLKKSNEWGTLEDAIWSKGEPEAIQDEKPKTRKKSKGTLERSKSAVEIKLKQSDNANASTVLKQFDASNVEGETSIELYNLPLSKKLSHDFIQGERMFNPDEDNSLARLVNNGRVVKSPTFEEVELDFRQAEPILDDEKNSRTDIDEALTYFDLRNNSGEPKIDKIDSGKLQIGAKPFYYNNVEVVEEPMKKVIVDRSCPGCRGALNDHQNKSCNKHSIRDLKTDSKIPDIIQTTNNDREKLNSSFNFSDNPPPVFQFNRQKFDPFDISKAANPSSTFHIQSTKVEPLNNEEKRESISTFQTNRTKFEQAQDPLPSKKVDAVGFETHFAKRVSDFSNSSFDPGSNVTVNSKSVISAPLSSEDRHNVSNVNVFSEEGTGLGLKELNRQDSETTPPLPSTPMPLPIPHKLTYITEIKVSTSQENLNDVELSDNDQEVVGIMESGSSTVGGNQPKIGAAVTSNGKAINASKKPPIPPRRSDVLSKRDNGKEISESDKQVVYVSEYKSMPNPGRDSQAADGSNTGSDNFNHSSSIATVAGIGNSGGSGGIGKKFEQWVFLGEDKDNSSSWEDNTSSGQPQPVTNILLTSNDDKIIHQ